MRILIAGGRLQGVEAVYLARRAGYESVVVDLDGHAPASCMCDRFIKGDAADFAFMSEASVGSDLILPCLENHAALLNLEQVSLKRDIPIIYDKGAYAVSSSKLKSDALFAKIGIPAPKPWPGCGYPIIAKPSGESGSRGVALLNSQLDADTYFKNRNKDETVLQQYLKGPMYSVEVIGNGAEYAALQTTRLFMDRAYDCKRVLAPAGLTPALNAKLRGYALKIAEHLKINGIFDVEAVLCGDEFYVLEIDARLPSQTPSAVYHSSGLNMLSLLAEQATSGSFKSIPVEEKRACLYEHIYFKNGSLETRGEHIMGQLGPLRLESGLFGADAAITSCMEGAQEWAATLICEGDDVKDVMLRRRESVRALRNLR